MNLNYVHKLLIAADEQPRSFLKLLGGRADHEVRLMAEAGLVDATLSDGKAGSFTVINHVTDLGHTFLRAFKDIAVAALVLPAPTKANGG